MTQDQATVSFRRRGYGVANGCLAATGSILFLGVALAALGGAMGEELWVRLMAGGMFGFFGVLMGLGAITVATRDDDPAAIRVGPGGMWLPGMGQLPWTAIKEVRIETVRGVGSGDAPVSRAFHRLGVVPVDPSLRPNLSTRAAWGMAMGFFAFLNRMAPEVRMGGDDPAPFGVSDSEVDAPWEDVVAAVRRFVPVIDEAERRAQARAARWGVRIWPGGTPPISGTGIRELDAAIERKPVRPSASMGSRLALPPVAPSAQPSATFSAPVPRLGGLAGSLVRIGLPIAFLVPFLGSMGRLIAGPLGAVYLVIFGAFIVAFLLPGLMGLARGLRLYRTARANPKSLAVGPEGIWLPGMGGLAWDRIATIATERAGWAQSSAGPQVERWRLAVVPVDGPDSGRSFGVNSDDLDAPFDDVLDLVRFYHPIEESS